MNVRVLTLFDDEPVEPRPSAVKPQRTATSKPKAEPVVTADPAAPAKKPEAAPAAKKTTTRTPAANTPAEKNYYTIGETAELFRVRTSHIRFWTIQFALKVRTTRKGDRLYTPDNIERLKLIHHLVKEQGFTIAGAKAKLKELRHTPINEVQQTSLKDALILLKKKLTDIRDQL
jgi:DNA-binding transcriptional MerR regulator